MAKGEDITTRFKVDISDLKKGISEANKNIKLANAEFKAASAGMDNWGKSSDGINAKLKQLNSVLTEQKSKLDNYKKQQQQLDSAYKTNGQRADELKAKLQQLASQGVSKTSSEYKKYQTALNEVEKQMISDKKASDDLKVTILNQQGAVNKTEAEIKKYSASLKDVEKAEKLAAKNGTSVEEELKKIAEQANNTESKLSSFASKLTSVLGKAALAGAAAVATGVVAMTKSAITAYAEYEQLVGGVDTLFKESSGKVQKYAQEAYKNQGMSANQYMETVTGFSASLLQSLGGDTEKAADVANMALTDMADNANKMGTDMSSIQYAYQGFAKQNYTMLDNLKLGYGGTQKEMERLLADATKISGVKYDINNLNDVYQAIHVIQGELGITGTTAKEAATTIQGSASAMKSAWTNLLVGLADDNANMEELIKNFIDSVGTFAQNLIPRIQQVLSTILQLVVENLPQIGTAIVQWMGTLVDNIIAALPPGLQEIVSAIKDGLVVAFQGLVDVAMSVINAFKEMSSWLSEHKTAAGILAGVIGTLTTAIIAYNVAQAIANAEGIAAVASLAATAVGVGALTVAETVATAATTAFGAVLGFLTSPVTLVVVAIGALITAIVLLVKNWDKVKEAGVKCWEGIKNIWNNASKWFNTTVIEPTLKFFTNMWNNVKNITSNVWNGIKSLLTAIWNYLKNIVTTVWGNIKNVISNTWNNIKSTTNSIWNAIKTLISDVWNNIKSSVSNTISSIVNLVTEAWNNIKSTTLNAWNNVKSTITNIWNNIKSNISNVINSIKSTITNVWNSIKSTTTSVWNNIKSAITKPIEDAKNTVSRIIETIKSTVKNIFNGIKPKLELSLPKVSVSGGEAPYGIGGKGKLPSFSVSWNALGGVFSKPTIFATPDGLQGVGEAGAEAIVPLERNKYWIRKVADEMLKQLNVASTSNNTIKNLTNNNTNNFTQVINAPKQPSRIELYRQTKNLLNLKGGAY